MSLKNCNTSDLVLLQITDLHIFANEDERFDGVDTQASLKQVLELIQDRQTDYDVLVATGDLVQTASQTAYERLINALSTLTGPVYTIPGNHDDPKMMRDAFTDTPLQFVTYSDHAQWRLIYLDSWKANSPGGRLDQADLDALKVALTSAENRYILICLHHHPVTINSPWMDSMMLENADELFDLIDNDQRVKGLLCGHIHQAFDTQRGHIKLMGTPSTCAQFEPGAKKFTLDEKQPGYRWLQLSAEGNIETGIERVPLRN